MNLYMGERLREIVDAIRGGRRSEAYALLATATDRNGPEPQAHGLFITALQQPHRGDALMIAYLPSLMSPHEIDNIIGLAHDLDLITVSDMPPSSPSGDAGPIGETGPIGEAGLDGTPVWPPFDQRVGDVVQDADGREIGTVTSGGIPMFADATGPVGETGPVGTTGVLGYGGGFVGVLGHTDIVDSLTDAQVARLATRLDAFSRVPAYGVTPSEPYDTDSPTQGVVDIEMTLGLLSRALGLPSGYRVTHVDQNEVQTRLGTLNVTVVGPATLSCRHLTINSAIPKQILSRPYGRQVHGALDPELHRVLLGDQMRAHRYFDPSRGWRYVDEPETQPRERSVQI